MSQNNPFKDKYCSFEHIKANWYSVTRTIERDVNLHGLKIVRIEQLISGLNFHYKVIYKQDDGRYVLGIYSSYNGGRENTLATQNETDRKYVCKYLLEMALKDKINE